MLPRCGERYLDNPFFCRRGQSRSTATISRSPQKGGDGAFRWRAHACRRVRPQAILKAAEHMPERPELWIVCGGGRKNPHIVGDCGSAPRQALRSSSAEDAGFNGDAIEAEAWAYLAVRSQRACR